MIRATAQQLHYVDTLIELGAEHVNRYDLTISSANKFIRSNRILLDAEIQDGLRPEDFGIPNH